MIGSAVSRSGIRWWRAAGVALLALLSLVLTAANARAESARVLVGGPGARDARASVGKVVRARVEAQQWRVVDAPAPSDDVDALIRCLGTEGTRECSESFLAAAAVERMVVFSVRTEGRRTPTVEIAGWIVAKTGDIVVTERRTCKRCKPAALESTTGELFAALWRQASTRAGPTTLVIRTVPVGAAVEVDGKAVGTSDLNLPTTPGVHKISMKRDGYRPDVRDVTANPGQTVLVEVELKPLEPLPSASGPSASAGAPAVPAPSPDDDHADDGEHDAPAPSRGWMPWATIGLGAATAIAGGALFALDEDAVQDGTAVPRYNDTAPLGIGLLAVGTAVAAAGVTWLLWPQVEHVPGDDEVEPDEGGPVVSAGGGRLWLGYQGRF